MKGLKRMKNFIISAVFASLFALVASADVSYFYWAVNASSDYAFYYARIKGVTSDGISTYLDIYGPGSSTAVAKLYASDYPDTGTTAGSAFANVTDYTTVGSQFLVELWTKGATDTDEATLIAWKSVDYSTVTANIFTQMNQSGNQPYTFTNFIPEPTSGLLLLLGSAALALRRKQKVA